MFTYLFGIDRIVKLQRTIKNYFLKQTIFLYSRLVLEVMAQVLSSKILSTCFPRTPIRGVAEDKPMIHRRYQCDKLNEILFGRCLQMLALGTLV